MYIIFKNLIELLSGLHPKYKAKLLPTYLEDAEIQSQDD